MPAAKKPQKATLRMFQVGFGDCVLLSLHYQDGEDRHILIDFGSTGRPEDAPDDLLLRVANEIREITKNEVNKNGKVHMLIATHRHKDHIGGFATDGPQDASGGTTGSMIRALAPDIVIQPWTEDPDHVDKDFDRFLKADPMKAHTPSTTRVAAAAFAPTEEDFKQAPEKHFVSTLMGMQAVAKSVADEASRLGVLNSRSIESSTSQSYEQCLGFMGENNMPNASAVANLREMGSTSKAYFVKANDEIPLSDILPGVKMHILGPPSLEQHREIRSQRSADENEFWMLHAMQRDFWGLQAATASLNASLNATFDEIPKANRLFPKAKVFKRYTPSHTRWFINQVRNVRVRQMMGLVRILDKSMNNTSVIALFEVNGHKLLFPGDAQIENWEYVFSQADKMDLVKDAILYKVGHHGSRNATPKTLWRSFVNRSKDGEGEFAKLTTVCSTMAGKHGHTKATAVPRSTLVTALKRRSRYHTTEDLRDGNELCLKIEIDLS